MSSVEFFFVDATVAKKNVRRVLSSTDDSSFKCFIFLLYFRIAFFDFGNFFSVTCHSLPAQLTHSF